VTRSGKRNLHLTSYLKRAQMSLFNFTLNLTYSILTNTARAHRKFELIRTALLDSLLSLIYIFLVTPIALRKRRNSKSEIAGWRKPNQRTGWCANEQSTADIEIYKNVSSGRDSLSAFVRANGDNWMLTLYDVLLKFRRIAKPPEEKELTSDLYVMF